MLSQDLLYYARKCLSEAARVSSESAVMVSEDSVLMIKFYRGGVSVIQKWSMYSIDAYINKCGRIYVLSLESRSPEDFIKNLMFTRNYMLLEPSEYNAPLPEPEDPGSIQGCYDARIESKVAGGDAGCVLREVFNEESRHDIDYAAGVVELSVNRKALVNSRGFEGFFTNTSFKGYVRVFKNNVSGQWAFTSTRLDYKLLRESVRKASSYVEQKLPREKIEPGEYRVALSPLVVGNIIEYVAEQSTAMSIDFGLSFLSRNKIGDRVFSSDLTVIDKPRDPELPLNSPFDDDGVRTYDKPIIENGVLKNILHNSKTAFKWGVKSTGNAGWISPHPWNLEVKPGDLSENEIYSALGNGILVTSNWYTRIHNFIEGLFSTVSRDAVLIVKNGEPIAIASGRVRIEGSFRELLSNVEFIGREQYPIEWWEVEVPVKAPYMIFSKARVSCVS